MRAIKGLQSLWLARAGAVLVAALALPAAASAQDVTYAGDVARVLQENCGRCHHPGTAAPMALQTYEQVRRWGSRIKTAVENRMMPPGWYIDRTVGIQHFKNDPSLSDQEIETIVAWVESGMPAGDPSQLPEPIEWKSDHEYWALEDEQGWGPPDLIIEPPPS